MHVKRGQVSSRKLTQNETEMDITPIRKLTQNLDNMENTPKHKIHLKVAEVKMDKFRNKDIEH